MGYPCSPTPIQFINCCQVMDCINIHSNDNSITVTKEECGIDLAFSSNNLDSILQINDGQCISMLKEFIDGKLVITPILDFDCIIDQVWEEICSRCVPPSCDAVINVAVITV